MALSPAHHLKVGPQKVLPSQSSLYKGRLQGRDPQIHSAARGPAQHAPGVLIKTNKRESLNLKERVAGGPEVEQGSERW